MDSDLSEQSTRTLIWLSERFCAQKSVSISRSSLFLMYTNFCKKSNLKPVCKATFGKLIRVQFPFVTSKRLGARGQSKYHYYGIALKVNADRKAADEAPTPLTRFSQNATQLHPNDYHAIVASLADGEDASISSDIFGNMYRIHCQCLVDAALSVNLIQMRHYIIHFWQQLPSHVFVNLVELKRMDSNFYRTLEEIYIKSDVNQQQLKYINGIAALNLIWIDKALNHVDPGIKSLKFKLAKGWREKVKLESQIVMNIKSLDVSHVMTGVAFLKQIDWNDALIMDPNVLRVFLTFLEKKNLESLSMDALFCSIEEMVKSFGKPFYPDLVLYFTQIHIFVAKELTAIQSNSFVSFDYFLLIITDYLRLVCFTDSQFQVNACRGFKFDDEYCLLDILKYLCLRLRTRFERVDKRWGHSSDKQWLKEKVFRPRL